MTRKAQHSIMEYILLTFFIMVVIIAIIFFLTGWQVSQFELEQEKTKIDRAFWLTKSFLTSQYFVKDNSMFDSMKLSAALDSCEELEKIFGYEWFAEVNLLGGTDALCTETDTDCNQWKFCEKTKNYTAYIIPVNIYKVMDNDMRGRVYIGTLKVGVYY